MIILAPVDLLFIMGKYSGYRYTMHEKVWVHESAIYQFVENKREAGNS